MKFHTQSMQMEYNYMKLKRLPIGFCLKRRVVVTAKRYTTNLNKFIWSSFVSLVEEIKSSIDRRLT